MTRPHRFPAVETHDRSGRRRRIGASPIQCRFLHQSNEPSSDKRKASTYCNREIVIAEYIEGVPASFGPTNVPIDAAVYRIPIMPMELRAPK